MKNTKTEIQEIPQKKFNIYKGISKLLFATLIIVCLLYTAKAAFTDTVLENLEKSYASSISFYPKLKKAAEVASKNEREGADIACHNFKALKAYKESKKIPLKNDYNPCVALASPQEGF